MTDTPQSTASFSPGEEQRLAEAVEDANIPTLLLTLYDLTRDERWISPPFTPTRGRGLDDHDSGGLSNELQREIRHACYGAIVARGRYKHATQPLTPEQILQAFSVSVGESVPPEYTEMLAARREASLPRQDAAERLTRDAAAAGCRVLVIGAGLSGLCAAVELERAGIEYVVVEKADDVGGVWLTNTYPGAGVDTPSHLYSFTFARNGWPFYFSTRDDVLDYARRIATDFGLRPRIRLGATVLSSVLDEARRVWMTRISTRDGEEVLETDVVISAVGAFNTPRWPNIEGLASFPGPMLHSAQYPDDPPDLAGKRVAVIGNGASAMQLVPAIAPEVAHLSVFQRSKQWIAPFEKFRRPISEAMQTLFREVPEYEAWYRLRLGWIFDSKTHAALQKDPKWPHPERSVNKLNDAYRTYFADYIRRSLDGRAELIADVLPDYPPFGKRMLLDNGWLGALRRDNVELISSPVVRIQGHNLIAANGQQRQADAIVLATGFNVVEFLSTFDVEGRDGHTLRDEWNTIDARAYLGLAVPGFPNFFMIYGPNTQLGHGGSLLTMVEAQVRYIVALISAIQESGLRTVEVRRDVFDDYNRRVDEAHERMIWTHPGMSVYYRNRLGRVVVTNPFRAVDFWNMTRKPDLTDFELDGGSIELEVSR